MSLWKVLLSAMFAQIEVIVWGEFVFGL